MLQTLSLLHQGVVKSCFNSLVRLISGDNAKTIAKFAGCFVFIGVTSRYFILRDKKRRQKLAGECEAAVVYIEIQGSIDPSKREQITINRGSGFIVSDDGLILTNAHVVINQMVTNQEVMVKLYDGRVVKGDVIAIDSVSDLAAVKVNTNDKLPPLRMGKSSELQPGEWVIAMSNPLGLCSTSTIGTVRAVNRKSNELGLSKTLDYIEIGASLNMGNSGGPLVNFDGEATGISTMTLTAGTSFAIPIEYAQELLEKVKNQEKGDLEKGIIVADDMSKGLKKGHIGITPYQLYQPISSHGVLVFFVDICSPAQEAGIQAGDIITYVNDQPIVSNQNIVTFLYAAKPISVTVIRGQNIFKTKVTPIEAM